LAERIDFEAGGFIRSIRDGDDVEIVLLQEQTVIDVESSARELLLDQQLGHIEHNLWIKLVNPQEFDDWHRVAGILSVDNLLEVLLQHPLTLLQISL